MTFGCPTDHVYAIVRTSLRATWYLCKPDWWPLLYIDAGEICR